MKRLKRQFQGLYWRQLYVTAGTVMLTLLLLGASFFALSYNYARNQRSDEIIAQAKVMSQLSVSYLETGRYLTMEELRTMLRADCGVGRTVGGSNPTARCLPNDRPLTCRRTSPMPLRRRRLPSSTPAER